MNVDIPICGYELIDDSQVQASSEFAWEDKKLAIFTEDETVDIREFEAKNWQCFQAPLSKNQLCEIATLLH